MIERLAGELGGKALFPSAGRPFLPFQRWAQRANRFIPRRLAYWFTRITACGTPTAARLASVKSLPFPSRRRSRARAYPVRGAGA